MPPLPGLAVNVTVLFAQAGFALGVTVTDAAIDPTTVMLTAFEVTVAPGEHDDEEVSSQVTTSPLLSVELANVLLLDPTFAPFTFHW